MLLVVVLYCRQKRLQSEPADAQPNRMKAKPCPHATASYNASPVENYFRQLGLGKIGQQSNNKYDCMQQVIYDYF